VQGADDGDGAGFAQGGRHGRTGPR
jgi:hypothetical protein